MIRVTRPVASIGVAAGLLAFGLALGTLIGMEPIPERLAPDAGSLQAAQYLDRNGEPLNVTLQNRWNFHDHRALHRMPPLLLNAFLLAEDKRFFDHGGVDWSARLHAIKQNLQAGHVVRGASTITEQVVRLLHPRPRTFWSRWLEGWEAIRLEQRFSKPELLEFYLNQVPYARQRRGVVQAANFYFNRDLSTLNNKELLSLAVLVRAPGRMDPLSNPGELDAPLSRLVDALVTQGQLTDEAGKRLLREPLGLSQPSVRVDAAHLVQHLKQTGASDRARNGRVTTTIDATLQQRVQSVLDSRIQYLHRRDVSDGAVLVVDHLANEVLAWVNAGGYSNQDAQKIDAVITPRQPGSTLKPFLYALALEKGWTAATLIDDSPFAIAVGNGMHSIHNYSRQYYGPLRLREALGNSLNVPAIHAAAYVGRDRLLDRLHRLGFASLTQHPDFYGDGLGLGNGEVSLFELVRAYGALANGGRLSSPRLVLDQAVDPRPTTRVFDRQVTSIIGDILSDPEARAREFGRDSILRLPVQTAVKTGTSTDYHDAWSVGFNHRYTVGVWMGNLDRRAMKEVTGSTGPGLVLRAVFAELNRFNRSRPLIKNLSLRAAKICPVTGLLASATGPSVNEWFRPGHEPTRTCDGQHDAGKARVAHAPANPDESLKLKHPVPGLQLAMDPRIPDELEVFPFELAEAPAGEVQWLVDGRLVAKGAANKAYLWPLRRGEHVVVARLDDHRASRPVRFLVK